jgi:hypothetical protein
VRSSQRWAGVWLGLATGICLAEPSFQLELDRLRYGEVTLQDVLVDVKSSNHYRLILGSLKLPFFPQSIERLTFDCQSGEIGTSMKCRGGRLAFHLPGLSQSACAEVNFILTPSRGELSLEPMRLARGSLRLKASYWGKHLNLSLSGDDLTLRDAGLTRVVQQLKLWLKLEARRLKERWIGKFKLEIPQGEALYLPIYLPFSEHPLTFTSDFSLQSQVNLRLQHLRLSQARVLEALADLYFEESALTRLNLRFAGDLAALFRLYGKPFLEGGKWEGIEISAGKIRGRLVTDDTSMIYLDRVELRDRDRRVGLERLDASLFWQLDSPPPSQLSWRAGHLYALPIGQAKLSFNLNGDDFRLQAPAEVPILNGRLIIDRLTVFDLSTSPKVEFGARLSEISLKLLTQALGWPSMQGVLSGAIPQVTYDPLRQTLEINGRLRVEAFSGEIIIERLAITDLFGPLPRLKADVQLHSLDLKQLTEHFAFGHITGTLTGHIRNLQLENWRPVAFDAWFGTPPDDRARHRISQRAIKNLADLGGGYAGLLSRTLLRVFDEFSYARLGLGCRLENGICELYGLEPTQGGYFIVIGGGLPRIDVIGYNRRIDWQTLITRLTRIVQLESLTPAIRP